MASLNVSVKGLDSLERKLNALGDQAMVQALGRLLEIEAQSILNDSLPLVPVDTGFLRQSGAVLPAAVSGSTVSVVVGYGAEYAIWVHENLEAHHNVGQSKFLEVAYLAWKARGMGGLGEAIKSEIRAQVIR